MVTTKHAITTSKTIVIFPQPLHSVLTLTTLPLSAILCHEGSTLILPALLQTFQLLIGIKRVHLYHEKLTGCSWLVVGIWVLGESHITSHTGHMTLCEYPFCKRGLGWFPWSILSTFGDDGPNDTICKYHNSVPKGLRVLLAKLHILQV